MAHNGVMRPAVRDNAGGVYITVRSRTGHGTSKTITVYRVTVPEMLRIIRRAVTDQGDGARCQRKAS